MWWLSTTLPPQVGIKTCFKSRFFTSWCRLVQLVQMLLRRLCGFLGFGSRGQLNLNGSNDFIHESSGFILHLRIKMPINIEGGAGFGVTQSFRDGHHRDRKYGPLFSSVAASSGIQQVKTPYRAPKANALCERFMGSLKRECLDHILVVNQQILERSVKEYGSYYNDARPHQGIQQSIPGRYGKRENPLVVGHIKSKPILGGLHHGYSRIAYLN